jgi:hypothetical protein
VLVPSLSLLTDTLREWTANDEDFEFLPVCSDDTVTDTDAAVSTTTDLGFPVTTDPKDIATFLRRLSGSRVVFATYQSSPKIAEAYGQGRVPGFDLVIADEAHRCAGRVSSDFATVLDADAIPARKRLFMTATPRFFTGRVVQEAKEVDFEVASMDDESRFGPVFHRLGFAEAIERELLTDYQVVVVGVDDATYLDWAQRGRFVTIDGTKVTDARTLAGQIGLAKAMRRYDLRRTISFHSRVSGARQFAHSMPQLIDWMPARQRPKGQLWSKYASGEMSAGDRSRLLDHLRYLVSDERGLLANARCLGEGIDVPALDGVAFIDPRRSEVDIVQAVGRAIRLAEDKTIGTIVIPVFIEAGDNPDAALDASAFKPVWDVVRALRAHDDQLGEQLDELRRQLGRGKKRIRTPPKIHLDLPARIGIDFLNAFDVQLVRDTTESWEFWYGMLEQYAKTTKSANPPIDCVIDGYKLGTWVNTQRSRYRTQRLSSSRAARLEALRGFTWEPRDDAWARGLESFRLFVHQHGHAYVPSKYRDEGFRLGQWVINQRVFRRKGMLDEDKQRRLEELGFVWNVPHTAWEAHFVLLDEYVKKTGSALVPQDEMWKGFALGRWVHKQRQARHTLSASRIECLESVPDWTWDVDAAIWDDFFALLMRFAKREGHARVPSDHIEARKKLGKWVENMRSRKHLLEPEQVTLLNSVGFVWNVKEAQWEDCLEALRSYARLHGNLRVPDDLFVDGVRLSSWIKTQRHQYNLERLGHERIRKLKTVPCWTWKPREDQWDEFFDELRAFVKHEGHVRFASGTALGKWLERERLLYRRGKLSDEHQRRLESIRGFAWDPRDARWDHAYQLLKRWIMAKSHPAPSVPARVSYRGFPLGDWVATQRALHRRGKLRLDRVKRLESLRDWKW